MLTWNMLCLLGIHICVNTILVGASFGFGNEQVYLNDVKVLTLHHNKMTTGRRSSPVPQLKCVGGSAGCSAFTPQVVQCHNQGSDGFDVQWECKSDMDNDYRFGQIEVTCEGYSHSEDEYILKGSCGLEYTLDLTKQGMHSNKNQKQHSYYGGGGGGGSYGNQNSYAKKSSGIGDWIMLAIVGVIIWGIYKSCVTSSTHNPDDPDDSHPRRSGPSAHGSGHGGSGGYGGSGGSGGYGGSDSCSGSQRGSSGGGGGGGGFWSGAATGGMLGYLFGSRANRGYGYNSYGSRSYSGGRYGGGSGFGGGGFGGGGFGGGGGGFSSSGTRTASGFGGTRRR